MDPTKSTLYEGLFLLNQQEVAGDLEGVINHLKEIFSRAEAEVVALKKWGERRLAYPIKGQKRGTYVLAYFRADRSHILRIERDCNLSEIVIRNMIIRADHVGETELELVQKEPDFELEAKLASDPSSPAAETPAVEADSTAATAATAEV